MATKKTTTNPPEIVAKPVFQDTRIPLQKRKELFADEMVLRVIFHGQRAANAWAKVNRPADWDRPMTDHERYLDYVKSGHSNEDYWGWLAIPAKVRRANYDNFVAGMRKAIGDSATAVWVAKHPFRSYGHRKKRR